MTEEEARSIVREYELTRLLGIGQLTWNSGDVAHVIAEVVNKFQKQYAEAANSLAEEGFALMEGSNGDEFIRYEAQFVTAKRIEEMIKESAK